MRVDYTNIPRDIRTCDMNCGSAFEPGASGLPFYCTPPVCVPAVIGALAVWWQNMKNKISGVCSLSMFVFFDVCFVLFLFYLTTCVCVCHYCSNWRANCWWHNNNKKIDTELYAVSGVCCSSMLHVCGCLFGAISSSLLSVYMCVRMPLSSRSIAEVPLSRALLGFPITAHHLCAFLM